MSWLGEIRCAQLTAAHVDHVPLNQALCWKPGLGGEQDTALLAWSLKSPCVSPRGREEEGNLMVSVFSNKVFLNQGTSVR